MAKLIYSLDGAFLGEFPLEKERMTIGRRPGNDIHIDNLAISGEHATIVAVGNDVYLEDRASTNGTVVNGRAIKKHMLQHGDVIELGKYQLKYIDEAHLPGKPAGGSMDYEKTMIIRPATAHVVPLVQPPQQLPEVEHVPIVQHVPIIPPSVLPSWARAPGVVVPLREEAPLARVQVLNGPSAGKELALSKASVTMGRLGVQVAAITRRPHGYFVTHVEGMRHPVVNGDSVGVQAHQLSNHDVIEIAGIKMEFYFVEV